MAIQFDKLPTTAPAGEFPLIPEGKYVATISKAEMKQPKDENKKPYLSIVWDVVDENNKSLGKLFDILSESDSPYIQFKLRSFIDAIDVVLGKTFELRDLTKVSVGKRCILNITIDKKSEPNKNQINIFADHPYSRITSNQEVSDGEIEDAMNEDIPFDLAEEGESASAEAYDEAY